jgi:hypothetical protein
MVTLRFDVNVVNISPCLQSVIRMCREQVPAGQSYRFDTAQFNTNVRASPVLEVGRTSPSTGRSGICQVNMTSGR